MVGGGVAFCHQRRRLDMLHMALGTGLIVLAMRFDAFRFDAALHSFFLLLALEHNTSAGVFDYFPRAEVSKCLSRFPEALR